MKLRAMTLAETMLYCTLAMMVLAILAVLFVTIRRSYEQVASSYLVGPEAETALILVRDDLTSTALGSLKVEAQGCSFLVPKAGVQSPLGGPVWSNYMHYTVRPGSNGVGNLVRWEEPLPAGFDNHPRPSTLASSQASGLDRVSLHQVLLLQSQWDTGFRDLVNAHQGLKTMLDQSHGELGGFQVSFVAPDNSLLPQQNGSRLIELNLRLLPESTRADHPAYFHLQMRICPRH